MKLLRGASEREVIARLDALLDRYGGRAAYGRKDQTSHAWIDHELDMLSNMSRTLTPIFLLVSAFLVNLTLSRLVALEREQIGLMKALGYRDRAIVLHYIKFVVAIVVIGVRHRQRRRDVARRLRHPVLRRLLSFSIPGLCQEPGPVRRSPLALSLAAAILGAIRALRDVVKLAPAVAMQPPAPPRFRRLLPERFSLARFVSQPFLMTLRNITRHPMRAVFTMLGMAAATGILIVSLFLRDTMEHLIDVTYFMADRQDATVSFVEKRPRDVVLQMARLPGVLAVEPYREVPVRIGIGIVERRIIISGQAARCRPQPHHRHRSAAGRAAGIRIGDLEHARTDPRREGRRFRRNRSPGRRAANRIPPGRGPGRGLFRHPRHDGCRRPRAPDARSAGRDQRQPELRSE